MSICRTFQEGLLSKRLLVYTDNEVSFYCSASFRTEGFGNPSSIAANQIGRNGKIVSLFKDFPKFLSSPISEWPNFANIVEMYSQRRISNEADILDALLGVLTHIRRIRPAAHDLSGLPFPRTSGQLYDFIASDSFEELVAAALSWSSVEDKSAPLQRLSIFPSWTWAGWSGSAQFWVSKFTPFRLQPFLRQVQLESSSGQTVVSPALWESNHNDRIQYELDMVTLIQFDAPMIPVDSFSVRKNELVINSTKQQPASSSRQKSLRSTIVAFRCLDPYTPDHLVENVRKGLWSCLMLCAGESEFDASHSLFVLVVRWGADQLTAERIGSFVDISGDTAFEHFREENWEWRRVRLI
jgi:hypothetical protein